MSTLSTLNMLYLFTLHATQYTLILKYSKYYNKYSTLDTSYAFLHPSFSQRYFYLRSIYKHSL